VSCPAPYRLAIRAGGAVSAKIRLRAGTALRRPRRALVPATMEPGGLPEKHGQGSAGARKPAVRTPTRRRCLGQTSRPTIPQEVSEKCQGIVQVAPCKAGMCCGIRRLGRLLQTSVKVACHRPGTMKMIDRRRSLILSSLDVTLANSNRLVHEKSQKTKNIFIQDSNVPSNKISNIRRTGVEVGKRTSFRINKTGARRRLHGNEKLMVYRAVNRLI